MSLRVLAIPEDPTYNGAVIQPLLGKLLDSCKKSRADVLVLTSPRIQSVEQALAAVANTDIHQRYRDRKLWVLLIDEDGKADTRQRQFASVKAAAEDKLNAMGIQLVCCAVVPELEIVPLAAPKARKASPSTWDDLRLHPWLKEKCFRPLSRQLQLWDLPDEGRGVLTRDAVANLDSLLQLCPELKVLREDLKEAIAALEGRTP